MKVVISRPVALTVAGSDSGGGAGIQADLNTFRAFNVFGTCAVTCITAQNPDRITAVQPARPEIVADQMECVFSAFRVGGATGMLYDAEIVETVASVFRKHAFRSLVVDPVMVATSGGRLLKKEALAVLKAKLLPQAAVVTPNLAEAEILWKRRILTLPEMREAARALSGLLGVAVLVKGGHRPRSRLVVDVLFDGNNLYEFSAPIIRNVKTHGTGCALSAAIAANLALGHDLVGSIRRAKKFVMKAIRNAIPMGNYLVLSL